MLTVQPWSSLTVNNNEENKAVSNYDIALQNGSYHYFW